MSPETSQVGESALRKVRRRLIPFMFLLYIVSYLDRINVGFAALQMNRDLGFSAAVYGLGAGIFFLSYVAFEVPSNLILARVGARLWIARIMITWGLISAGMMFVTSATSFYVLRFLLGLGEAGFFPGMVLYLTYWFPAAERARALALFLTATAIAGVVGGPVSGVLLTLQGFGGLAGWQWLFLLEGLPAVVLGFVVLVYLTDRPEEAQWLTPDERAWLVGRLTAERAVRERLGRHRFRDAVTNGRVWLLAWLYFSLVIGLYGISFWLPQIVQALAGVDDLTVGLISAIPYVVAAVGMVIVGSHSDRTRERRWHVAGPALVGAAGFLMSGLTEQPVPALAALSIAALGVWGALGPFWTLPTAFLSGTAAAAGIALINSVGNVGGFVGPYLLGYVRTTTTSFAGGLFVLSGLLVVGAILAVAIRHDEDGSG
jgi:ACS family tartrate transporter-like MFS transporter